MNFEIERKFLVRGDDWQDLATGHTSIRQAYLTTDGKSSIRFASRVPAPQRSASSRGARRCAGWSSVCHSDLGCQRSCRSGKARSSRRCAT